MVTSIVHIEEVLNSTNIPDEPLGHSISGPNANNVWLRYIWFKLKMPDIVIDQGCLLFCKNTGHKCPKAMTLEGKHPLNCTETPEAAIFFEYVKIK